MFIKPSPRTLPISENNISEFGKVLFYLFFSTTTTYMLLFNMADYFHWSIAIHLLLIIKLIEAFCSCIEAIVQMARVWNSFMRWFVGDKITWLWREPSPWPNDWWSSSYIYPAYTRLNWHKLHLISFISNSHEMGSKYHPQPTYTYTHRLSSSYMFNVGWIIRTNLICFRRSGSMLTHKLLGFVSYFVTAWLVLLF